MTFSSTLLWENISTWDEILPNQDGTEEMAGSSLVGNQGGASSG